jgi:hypothetical protein
LIFNSGVDHPKAGEEMVGQLHDMAAGTYPFLTKVDPKLFTMALAAGELAVGGLLLSSIVPLGLAGLALTGFARHVTAIRPDARADCHRTGSCPVLAGGR